jgi:hypothetical protein
MLAETQDIRVNADLSDSECSVDATQPHNEMDWSSLDPPLNRTMARKEKKSQRAAKKRASQVQTQQGMFMKVDDFQARRSRP